MTMRRAGVICLALLFILSSLAYPALSSDNPANCQQGGSLPLSLSGAPCSDAMYFLPAKYVSATVNPQEQVAVPVSEYSQKTVPAGQVFLVTVSPAIFGHEADISKSISPRAP